MMKKTLFACLMLACTLNTWASENEVHWRWAENVEEVVKEFSESEVALPAVPDANQGDWLDIYVSPTFRSQPRILLSSVARAPDGSIRYLLNNRSASGYDNITAEGLLCITGTRLLDSDGSKLKTFAYADTVNQRWIMPRNATWQTIGGKRNGISPVRRVLYDAFCTDANINSDDALRQRLRDFATEKVQLDYSK